MKRYILCLTIPLLFNLYACSEKSNGNAAKISEKNQDSQVLATSEASSEQNSEPSIRIYDDQASAQAFKNVGLTNITYKDGKFDFIFLNEGMDLGQFDGDPSESMQNPIGHHIEIHVSGVGCKEANYTPIDFTLEDGTYDILALVSTSKNIFLKGPRSQVAARIELKNGKMISANLIPIPLMIANCGAETTFDEEGNGLLDLYFRNITLGISHVIQVKVNGKSFAVNKWKPLLLRNLKKGENVVEVYLRDHAGQLVKRDPLTLIYNKP